jgi:hypothetical protein
MIEDILTIHLLSLKHSLLQVSISNGMKGIEEIYTHGVRFLVVPPVGPAVPLSLTAYVDPSVRRVFSANPATISGVGPE